MTTPHGRVLVDTLTELERAALLDVTLTYGDYETRVMQALMRYVAEEMAQTLIGALLPALNLAVEALQKEDV